MKIDLSAGTQRIYMYQINPFFIILLFFYFPFSSFYFLLDLNDNTYKDQIPSSCYGQRVNTLDSISRTRRSLRMDSNVIWA
ncbi:hypothetical protein LXL04_013074 [Taraxacum kok-saghyz]